MSNEKICEYEKQLENLVNEAQEIIRVNRERLESNFEILDRKEIIPKISRMVEEILATQYKLICEKTATKIEEICKRENIKSSEYNFTTINYLLDCLVQEGKITEAKHTMIHFDLIRILKEIAAPFPKEVTDTCDQLYQLSHDIRLDN